MTTPAQPPPPAQAPPIDPGNTLLAVTPAQLTCSHLQTADGQRLALTIRTQTTTLTVALTRGDAADWAQVIRRTADAMSAAGLIVAGPGIHLDGQPGQN